jgi:phosphoglucomutase
MTTIQEKLAAAVAAGQLLPQSLANIEALLAAGANPLYLAAVTELAAGGHWSELNDRFFRTLAFGTGGLRGRTIGKVVTTAEQGAGGPAGRPQHPCVGTNAMNFFNLSRAVRGMIATLAEQLAAAGESRRVRLVFSHDSRHFSREFAEFAARVGTDLGCDVWLFEADRSTPELSFAIRHLRADGGAMLTASHNPPHDNGFKAYFNDGAQLVSPFAEQVIDKVNALATESYEPLPAAAQGRLTTLGAEMDAAYRAALESLVLDPAALRDGPRVKIVFTNLHGTGGRIIPRLLREAGCVVSTVAAQDGPDGCFPTVASPNPENAEALKLATEQAAAEGADVVIATDPDCDRVGIAARGPDGRMVLFSGNQTGSMLVCHRVGALFASGVLNDGNRERACVIKTFVTSDLQAAICRHFGIACVNTLTGFKFIAAKLAKYEHGLPASVAPDYRALAPGQARSLLLERSRFYVFGSEESYGYLGHDLVRDKDGNGAALMVAEMTAHALSLGLTLPEFLERIFMDFGYYAEVNKSIYFEGAEGAAKIARLAASYADQPPAEIAGAAVVARRDFSRDQIHDEEGDLVPKEAMMRFDLADGRSFAVRPSGTEPKIKYYLFGKEEPPPGQPFAPAGLAAAKSRVDASLAALWTWLETDATTRAGA